VDYAELLQQVQAAAARDQDTAEPRGAQPQAAWTQVRAVLGTLDRKVAEVQALRQRLPREFDALMA
jgi:hypothetical protein